MSWKSLVFLLPKFPKREIPGISQNTEVTLATPALAKQTNSKTPVSHVVDELLKTDSTFYDTPGFLTFKFDTTPKQNGLDKPDDYHPDDYSGEVNCGYGFDKGTKWFTRLFFEHGRLKAVSKTYTGQRYTGQGVGDYVQEVLWLQIRLLEHEDDFPLPLVLYEGEQVPGAFGVGILCREDENY